MPTAEFRARTAAILTEELRKRSRSLTRIRGAARRVLDLAAIAPVDVSTELRTSLAREYPELRALAEEYGAS